MTFTFSALTTRGNSIVESTFLATRRHKDWLSMFMKQIKSLNVFKIFLYHIYLEDSIVDWKFLNYDAMKWIVILIIQEPVNCGLVI